MFFDRISRCFKIRGMEYVPVILRPNTKVLDSLGVDGTVGFISEEHEKCFIKLMEESQTSMEDMERLQLLYIFSCPYCQESGINFEVFYDYEEKGLRVETLKENLEKLSSKQKMMLERAIHLYNDYYDDVDSTQLYSNLDWRNIATMINAEKIRFF